jgi:hypothetical protein
MTQTSNTVDYRVATGNDETDILVVLEEVAPEIPLSVDASDSQDPYHGHNQGMLPERQIVGRC